MFIETTYFHTIQKNHFCILTYVISYAFQTQPLLTLQNQLNMQIVTLLLRIPLRDPTSRISLESPPNESLSDEDLLPKPLIPPTTFNNDSTNFSSNDS